MVNYDDAGNEVHTPLNFTDTDNAPPPTVSVKPSRLVKRAVNWPSGTTPVCENTAWFAKSDFYPKGTAWDKFFDLCWHYRNRKIWQSTGEGVTAIYQDHGSAIAFECDYTGNPCSQVEWNEAVNWVAGTCAQSSTHMKPGYLNIPKWGKVSGITWMVFYLPITNVD